MIDHLVTTVRALVHLGILGAAALALHLNLVDLHTALTIARSSRP